MEHKYLPEAFWPLAKYVAKHFPLNSNQQHYFLREVPQDEWGHGEFCSTVSYSFGVYDSQFRGPPEKFGTPAPRISNTWQRARLSDWGHVGLRRTILYCTMAMLRDCCGVQRMYTFQAFDSTSFQLFMDGVMSKDVIPAICVANTRQQPLLEGQQLMATWRNPIHSSILKSYILYPPKVREYVQDITTEGEYYPDFKTLFGANHPYGHA